LSPGVCGVALFQPFPTPMTNESSSVVMSVAVGAPGFPDPDAVAPIAPDPFAPEMSTPLKLTTVIDEIAGCEIVAVTETPVSGVAADARQISAVPTSAFGRGA